MAARFAPPLQISRDDYHDIFSSSDEEMDNKDLDTDVSEVEDESNENDENGSEGKGDEPVEWTDHYDFCVAFMLTILLQLLGSDFR